MDQEAKKLLEEVKELAEENNRMLLQIRGVQKRQAFLRALKIVFIIAVALGALYFLDPYIQKLELFLNEATSTIDKFKSIMPR